jgi:hypothetical protein
MSMVDDLRLGAERLGAQMSFKCAAIKVWHTVYPPILQIGETCRRSHRVLLAIYQSMSVGLSFVTNAAAVGFPCAPPSLAVAALWPV